MAVEKENTSIEIGEQITVKRHFTNKWFVSIDAVRTWKKSWFMFCWEEVDDGVWIWISGTRRCHLHYLMTERQHYITHNSI